MAATHGIGPGSVVYCYDHGLMGDLSSRLVVVLGTPVNGRVEVTEVLARRPRSHRSRRDRPYLRLCIHCCSMNPTSLTQSSDVLKNSHQVHDDKCLPIRVHGAIEGVYRLPLRPYIRGDIKEDVSEVSLVPLQDRGLPSVKLTVDALVRLGIPMVAPNNPDADTAAVEEERLARLVHIPNPLGVDEQAQDLPLEPPQPLHQQHKYVVFQRLTPFLTYTRRSRRRRITGGGVLVESVVFRVPAETEPIAGAGRARGTGAWWVLAGLGCVGLWWLWHWVLIPMYEKALSWMVYVGG